MTEKNANSALVSSDRLVINRDSGTPIYQQLMGQFKRDIGSGVFSTEERFPTEQEISEQLGLSLYTVRQALLGLAQEGYLVRRRGRGSFACQPRDKSVTADELRGKTCRIGVVMPWGEQTFFAGMLNDVENVMHGQGYRTMLVNNRDDAETEVDRLREMLRNGVDGIIWMCPAGGAHPEVIELIRAMLPNVVGVDRLDPVLADELSLVNADNAGGMAALVEKLHQSGRRNIALVRTAANVSSINDRTAGYRRALKKAGIADEWIFNVDLASYSASDAYAAGYAVVEKILAGGQQFDAICCCTDYLAIGVMNALRDKGHSVPDDIAVTGFDDSAGAMSVTPRLTSVHMNLGSIATEAAELLLRQMQQHDAGGIVSRSHINVPVEIVMRESARW